MSAHSEDTASEESESFFDDEWVRDVAKMGIGWLIGTITAILLLIFVGPKVF